ncbi:mRNA polyadenylation-related protein [Trichosporon asahii var. asahii CBS 8904]|uniref:mRNA polyadenylation-related protein n=1 Tax=Trichosporon asahii var. asahii (strain CBS 8904) TaxID=1220162 RepID=K1VL42_TRIAC|nr:mRNA polyadenylation-related protein [Trichosporon asahii var. asahii CBS 8904]
MSTVFYRWGAGRDESRVKFDGTHISVFDLKRQPPLQLNSLAGTYASSAYVAAAKQGKKELDQLAEDVTSFSKTLRDDAQLKAKIARYLIASTKQRAALDQWT